MIVHLNGWPGAGKPAVDRKGFVAKIVDGDAQESSVAIRR